ncbi:hypothetical protein Tco_1540081 [Tanacetum coccineum]
MEGCTTASSLEAEHDSGNINRTQSMATLNESIPQGTDSSSGLRCQDTILGVQKLKLVNVVGLNLLLPVLVYVARHSLTAVRHKLMLPGITSYCWAKTVNGERQIQALVDKKKVIITETSIRSDLKLDDAEGTYCLPTATIFAELERMVLRLHPGMNLVALWHLPSSVFLDKKVEGMSRHKGIYVIPSHTKKLLKTWVKIQIALLIHFYTPIYQPSLSKPQKKKSRRKQRKESSPTEPIPDEATNEDHVDTPSCDPPQSGEDRMQLTELMDLCTQLQSRVLAQETTKSNQALEIESLKRRVKSLEKIRKSRTLGFKILRKVGSASRVESSNDVSLGAQEDASKQGRKIDDLDADAEVTLVDKTQEMNDDNLMFDTGVLEEQEIKFEKVVEEPVVSVATTTKSIPVSAANPVTTAGEVVTTANVEVTTASAPTTTIDELTMAQTLIEIKVAKPKGVTSTATKTTITRPKARGGCSF